jgi:protein-disulfide isomerase
MTRHHTFAGLIAAAAMTGLVAFATTGCSNSSPVAPTGDHPLPTLAEMLADKTLGSATAPVTMIEYSSLGCSHCADFDITTFPQIKGTYIDTGRVRFIYRDYPLDPPSLTAAMVARCSGDRFFSTIDALFLAQASWANASNYTGAIKTVVAGIGMSAADVDACLAVPGLQSGVLAIMQTGTQQYSVGGTPTFFINTRRVDGAYPFATFAAIIDSF